MITLVQSKNIYEFQPVLEGLLNDFGYIFWDTLLKWCNIIECNKPKTKYWQTWLIKHNDDVIGTCALYSQKENSTEELWLGWFGVIPEYRNHKIGEKALKWMENYAKSWGCKKIMSYVDEAGAPLNFYYRNGFKRICSVQEYLDKTSYLTKEDFEGMNDHIIEKIIALDTNILDDYIIREMNESDIDICAKLIVDTYQSEDIWLTWTLKETIRDLKIAFESPKYKEKYFLAVLNEEIIGIAGIGESFMTCGAFELSYAVVKPEYQRKGIGTALTLERLNYAKSFIKHGTIFTSARYPKFFEKLGFNVISKDDDKLVSTFCFLKF